MRLNLMHKEDPSAMKRLHIFELAATLICLIALVIIAFLVAKPAKDPSLLQLTTALNDFSLKFYNVATNRSGMKNLCFSSPIISLGLSSVMLGAKGKTETQIFRGLSLDKSLKKPRDARRAYRELISAIETGRDNYVYVENEIMLNKQAKVNAKIEATMLKYYRTRVVPADFKENSSQINIQLNQWLNNVTHGKIAGFIRKPVSATTQMALLNALYLQKDWLLPFRTITHNFLDSNSTLQRVPFLFNRNVYGLTHSTKKNYTLVSVPYKEDLNFFLILPNAGTSLSEVMENMSMAEIEDSIAKLKPTLMDLYIPKVVFNNEYNLKQLLPFLGITDLFSTKANLTRLAGKVNLILSAAIHKIVFEIDEKPASSSSSSGQFPSKASMSPMRVEAWRPFAYFVRNCRNQLIYVMGRVVSL